MKKFLIASTSALALLLAGVSYAAQHNKPAGDASATQSQDSMKQDSMKKDSATTTKKSASKKKCPEGQMYSKQEKKCVAKKAS